MNAIKRIELQNFQSHVKTIRARTARAANRYYGPKIPAKRPSSGL